MQDLHHSVLKYIRKPGEVMEKTPEETGQIYYSICRDPKPYLAFLETDVVPKRVYAGTEISHMIRYAICPSPSVPLTGKIIRTVTYNQRKVFQDSDKYEFKRGTWTVDAYLLVPADAVFGIYSVETTVVYSGRTVRMNNQFEVRKKEEE
jgi:hypothetical protein